MSKKKQDEKKTTSEKHENIRERRLYKSRDDKIVDGVLGGIAEYFGVDATLVRIIGVLMLIAQPGGFILFYIVAMIIIPESPRGEKPVEAQKSRTDGNLLFGGILIALGVVFLLKNFVPWFRWDYMWPVLVIAMGIYMISRR
ncbi:MAG: PspC domain-containing protein [archaeon]